MTVDATFTYEEGHDAGYKEGFDIGFNAGHESGYREGNADGRRNAESLFAEANRQEYVKGHAAGREEGYNEGYEKAMNITHGRQAVLDTGITPEFMQGWNAMLALFEQEGVTPDERYWFEDSFKKVIVPDALDMLRRAIRKRGKQT